MKLNSSLEQVISVAGSSVNVMSIREFRVLLTRGIFDRSLMHWKDNVSEEPIKSVFDVLSASLPVEGLNELM